MGDARDGGGVVSEALSDALFSVFVLASTGLAWFSVKRKVPRRGRTLMLMMMRKSFPSAPF